MAGLDDLPFTWQATAAGAVFIHHRGRLVKTLKGTDGRRFLARVDGLDEADAQQLMARATGQFKFGNENAGRNKPR